MSAPREGAPVALDAPAPLPEPPIVLRSVLVDDDHREFALEFERTPAGDYCALEIAGRAVTRVGTLAGRPGASLSLRDPQALYALRDVLGQLITEAEAAGLLVPAWADALPPGDRA